MDSEPQKIIKLDESVVNRIAAGEIIQTPSSALKELIENSLNQAHLCRRSSLCNFSLDAKAKNILITVKAGGIKSLQISDNGTGILKENLPILCERFTTSKLQNYSDLQSINTYGFRGEALASISIISRLSIQTKTRNDPCAYKVKYENGLITEGPTPCAGNQGTTITFDDIFYNNPIRLKTLKFPSDEFQKIFDVTSKYAVHNHQISFALKKYGENNSIKTCPSSSPVDIIRSIYGPSVANSLLEINYSDDKLNFTMNGFISKGDYSGKKRHFLLFINHRLVESKSLKKAVFDDIYSAVLPNNVHPFVYMSLEMDPMNLDVNVSPTKHEVNFLNEDFIVEKIKEAVEETLLNTNETKKLYTQQLLPGAASVSAEKSFEDKEKVYAKDMVRTDCKAQTIVKFLHPDKASSSQGYHSQSPKNVSQIITNPALNKSYSKKQVATSQLSSINELRKEIAYRCDEKLRDQIEKLKFVGVANKTKALVQCENILYLCNTQQLCQELFYQQAINNFDNFSSIEFEKPLDVEKLALIGFSMKECRWEEDDGPKEELAKQVKVILMEQREMLREYCSIAINIDGELEALPAIIPLYMPLMSHLPLFIIRMACEVNYEDEKECFKSICEELATFYSRLSLISSDNHHLAETIIYPEIRRNLSPPAKFLTDKTLLKLTSLQELYKVFERC